MTTEISLNTLPYDLLELICTYINSERDCQAMSCASRQLNEAMTNAYKKITARVAPELYPTMILLNEKDESVLWKKIVLGAFRERDGGRWNELQQYFVAHPTDQLITKMALARR